MLILHLMLGMATQIQALDNGLALTPPMGWLTWAGFDCATDCEKLPDICISEKLIKRMADLMVSGGYLAAGYDYIGIDDCWMEMQRTADGKLQADKKRFPSGMKALADYVHSKGLKFGLYEDYGNLTCQGYPGVMGHEQTDVDTLVGWGVDYIKLDGCYSTDTERDKGYPDFGKKLNASGRPILYSCSWPAYPHHVGLETIAKDCNLWRIYEDISPDWTSVFGIMNWFGDNQDQIQQYAGPGHWNDPDMLVIGLGSMTDSVAHTQMAVWAVLAAPLLMSTELSYLSAESKATLLNKDIIAVNQDPLGIQGRRITIKGDIHVWTRELSKNSYAVAFVNHNPNNTAEGTFSFKAMGIPEKNYSVKDLFKSRPDQILKPGDELKTSTIKSLDVAFFKFIPKSSDDVEVSYKGHMNTDVNNEILNKE